MSSGATLDPHLIGFIEAARLNPSPELLPVSMVRQYIAAGSVDPFAPANLRTRAMQIPGPAGPLAARLYEPTGAPAQGPGLVYFHGGGFLFGDLETHDGACRRLCAASGIRVLAVDYRLAPEHVLPAAFDDAESAVRWVFDHAAEMGFERAQIGVGGDSAGALLAAWVAVVLRADPERRLRHQTLIYPPFLFAGSTPSREAYEGYMLTQSTLDYFTRAILGPRGQLTDARLNLLKADLAGAAPAHLVIAGFDPLQDEELQYAAALKAHGVPTRVTTYAKFPHGFMNLSPLSPAVAASLNDIGAALAADLA